MSDPTRVKSAGRETPGDGGSRGQRHALLVLIAVLALFVAGCGGDGDDSGDDASFEPVSDDSGDETRAADLDASGDEADAMTDGESAPDAGDGADAADESAADAEGPATDANPASLSAVDLQRQIIFTASVHVSVDDVAAASDEAVEAIESVGGFVFGQDSVGGAEPRTTYEFKVLPEDFDRALDALEGIGDLVNQTVSADDVTERVVDLGSRISVAELGVERLRTAAEEATSLEDFAELERLLLDRETELELLRGQLRTLEDQVDLATITLTLSQDRVENNLQLVVTTYDGHDAGLACPGQAELSVEAGTELTVCYELINTGDQTLVDLVLTDSGVGIDEATDVRDVFGSLEQPLAPGQSTVVAFEAEPERDLRLRPRASARPTAGVDEEPAGPPVSTSRNIQIDVRPSEDGPGFGDGFDAGRDVISGLWTMAKVAAGFLVPLLVLAPIGIGIGWLGRRWRQARSARRPDPVMPPPPPPTVPATASVAAAPVEPANHSDADDDAEENRT